MRDYYAVIRYILEKPGISLKITKHNIDILAYPKELIRVDLKRNRTRDYIYNLLKSARLPFLAFVQDNDLWFANLTKGYIQLARKINLMHRHILTQLEFQNVSIVANYHAFGFSNIAITARDCDSFIGENEIKYVCRDLGLDFALEVCEIYHSIPEADVNYGVRLQPQKFTLKGAFLTHQFYDIPADTITAKFLLSFSEIVRKTREILKTEITQTFTKPLTSKKKLLKAYTDKFLLPIFSQKLNITELDLGKIEDAEKGLKYIKKLLIRAENQ